MRYAFNALRLGCTACGHRSGRTVADAGVRCSGYRDLCVELVDGLDITEGP
jgi:hypothetical protein